MYGKVIINSVLILILTGIQISFVGALPGIFSCLNLVLVMSLYRLGFYGLENTAWWAVAVGVIWDFFSFLPFGSNLLSLFLAVLLGHFLLVNFFTNRSLYSFLALGFFTTICFEFCLYVFANFASFLTKRDFILPLNKLFWRHELNVLLINLAFVFFLFYIYGAFSSKLKSTLLLRSR